MRYRAAIVDLPGNKQRSGCRRPSLSEMRSHLSVTTTVPVLGRTSVIGFAGGPTLRGGKLLTSLLVARIP